MNKTITLFCSFSCIAYYSLWPFLASLLLVFISDASLLSLIHVGLWSLALTVHCFALALIVKRNKLGLHLLFSVVLVNVLLSISDEVFVFLDSERGAFPVGAMLENILIPLFMAWLLYKSDIKDYFIKEKSDV
ncbi:hypothetical protein [Agaribacterium sp. ZY112]|uniref:hypothetical protein n=1 Tax=Agaribacterium sp. ZY112 TaxID=3233574 RepID=UPI0035257F2D